MAWAGDRPGELRRGAAVFFAVAAVGMLAFIAVLVANAAGDAYRRNVDERLTALANDGSTSFDPRGAAARDDGSRARERPGRRAGARNVRPRDARAHGDARHLVLAQGSAARG
jgi:hypothetical protein